MRVLCAIALMLAAAVGGSVSLARADTCQVHYSLCIGKYGHDPKKCACARNVCLKQVGKADAGPKWNWIPGINACFRK
jgi:hypothetical protein